MSLFETECGEALAPDVVAEFGESVTYTSPTYGALTIVAPVRRQPVQRTGDNLQQRVAYEVEIQVAHATLPAVSVNADTVTIARHAGISASTRTMRVAAILSESGGLWTLGLS